MNIVSKLFSSIMPMRRRRGLGSTSTHLPVTRDHALSPATAASSPPPTSAAAPWPARPAAPPSVPMAAALDLRSPSLRREAGIASSLPPPAASVEMTSIVTTGGAEVIEENPDQFPSSSSIMDNLQRSSSLGSFSSMEPTNLMEAGGSPPDDSNYHQTENIISRLLGQETQTENIIRMLGQGTWNNLAARENGIMTTPLLVANNLINNNGGVHTSRSGNVSNEIEKKKKGLLGCIFTMTERVHTCVLAILAVCGGFFVIIVQENKKHIPIALILMSGNILAMLISCFILSPLASYMKESESIEVAKKGTYIWLLLAMLIYYYDEFCIALRLVANIPAWLAWTLGIIGSFLMLLGGVWFICKKWPEIVEKMKAGHVEANVKSDGGN